jgi:CheY-like chemotaxis protein
MEKARILVVEDNRIISLEIRERLNSLGYEVVDSVTTGELALERAARLMPDLILMDIRLKGEMDGIEAAAKIKSLLGIPIIYLTAYSDNAILERAKVTEPYGYIIKPLDERALHSTIEITLYKLKMNKPSEISD